MAVRGGYCNNSCWVFGFALKTNSSAAYPVNFRRNLSDTTPEEAGCVVCVAIYLPADYSLAPPRAGFFVASNPFGHRSAENTTRRVP